MGDPSDFRWPPNFSLVDLRQVRVDSRYFQLYERITPAALPQQFAFLEGTRVLYERVRVDGRAPKHSRTWEPSTTDEGRTRLRDAVRSSPRGSRASASCARRRVRHP